MLGRRCDISALVSLIESWRSRRSGLHLIFERHKLAAGLISSEDPNDHHRVENETYPNLERQQNQRIDGEQGHADYEGPQLSLESGPAEKCEDAGDKNIQDQTDYADCIPESCRQTFGKSIDYLSRSQAEEESVTSA